MSLCGVWINLGNERFRHLEIGFKLANQRMSAFWSRSVLDLKANSIKVNNVVKYDSH